MVLWLVLWLRYNQVIFGVQVSIRKKLYWSYQLNFVSITEDDCNCNLTLNTVVICILCVVTTLWSLDSGVNSGLSSGVTYWAVTLEHVSKTVCSIIS